MKLKEIMFVGEEDSEKGYTAQALGYSIFTEGDTLEELKENIKDALKCHFDKKDKIPNCPSRSNYREVFKRTEIRKEEHCLIVEKKEDRIL